MKGPRFARLGEILVNNGVLTPAQLGSVLDEQRRTGRPFGLIAESLFQLSPRDTEVAWTQQYANITGCVDLDTQPIDTSALSALDRRQAWQMRMLPLRREDGALVIATTADRLARAATFAWSSLGEPVYLVIVDEDQLLVHLMEHYPWAVMERIVDAHRYPADIAGALVGADR